MMYTMSQTYQIWFPEDVEFGEGSERGWAIEDEEFDDLEELLDSVEGDASWLGWSNSAPDGNRAWITSEASTKDYGTGEQEVRSLFIRRDDGKPLTKREVREISDRLRLSRYNETFLNPRKKASTRRKNAGLNEVRVKFKNSKYNYTTAVSANTTHRQAYEYFVGQYLNVASYPNENMQKVVGIDYNGREVDPPGWAEKWLAGKDPRYPVAPHHRIFVGGAKSNPRKKAPKSRKNAMATKKLSSFRGDKRRVAKGMMSKGYRYYLTTGTHVPGRYAKTLAQANALSKKLSARLGRRGWNIRVYKLVK